MAILEYEAELTTQAETFIIANYTVDQPEELEIAGKLRVRLPSKITIDLSQAGISFPEGTNINFTMSEGFVREEWGGSNQTALPEVSDFFTLKTPIQGISTQEAEFTQPPVELIRIRDNEIEADALFTPAFVANATLVGEIAMSAVASQQADVNYIAAMASSQSAEFDAEPLATRIFQLFPQEHTAQFTIETIGGKLFVTIANTSAQTSLDAEGVRFPGIADENLETQAIVDANLDRFRFGEASLSTNSSILIDYDRFRDNTIAANSDITFDVGRITDFPFDIFAEVELEDIPANINEMRTLPDENSFYTIYERNDGLYNMEAFNYAGTRQYSNIGYSLTDNGDFDNLPYWRGPYNVIDNTFMVYNDFGNQFDVLQRPGQGLIDAGIPIGFNLANEKWLVAPKPVLDNIPAVWMFFSTPISNWNGNENVAAIRTAIYNYNNDEYEVDSLLKSDITDTNGQYTSRWGEIYIFEAGADDPEPIALVEIIFEEVGGTDTYTEIHQITLNNTGNYDLNARWTDNPGSVYDENITNVGNYSMAKNTENSNWLGVIEPNGNLGLYNASQSFSDNLQLEITETDIVLENNHYFYLDQPSKIKTVELPNNQPIQTITKDYIPLTASNTDNQDYILFYESATNKIKIHRDIR